MIKVPIHTLLFWVALLLCAVGAAGLSHVDEVGSKVVYTSRIVTGGCIGWVLGSILVMGFTRKYND